VLDKIERVNLPQYPWPTTEWSTTLDVIECFASIYSSARSWESNESVHCPKGSDRTWYGLFWSDQVNHESGRCWNGECPDEDLGNEAIGRDRWSKELVMATKFHQTRFEWSSENHLRWQIWINLGRDDYPTISIKLFLGAEAYEYYHQLDEQWKIFRFNFLKSAPIPNFICKKEPKNAKSNIGLTKLLNLN